MPAVRELTTPEPFIVIVVVDGKADTSLVHLPAVRCNKGGFRFDSYEFAPATWPPACGCVRSGSVYVRGGLLENARVCPDCEATL